jgi:hypothetical protein
MTELRCVSFFHVGFSSVGRKAGKPPAPSAGKLGAPRFSLSGEARPFSFLVVKDL